MSRRNTVAVRLAEADAEDARQTWKRDDLVTAYDRLTHARTPAHVVEPLTVREPLIGEHTLTREQWVTEAGA